MTNNLGQDRIPRTFLASLVIITENGLASGTKLADIAGADLTYGRKKILAVNMKTCWPVRKSSVVHNHRFFVVRIHTQVSIPTVSKHQPR